MRVGNTQYWDMAAKIHEMNYSGAFARDVNLLLFSVDGLPHGQAARKVFATSSGTVISN